MSDPPPFDLTAATGAEAWLGEPMPGAPSSAERSRSAPGEVPASSGGVVDLDRILGRIPIVLVFLDDPTSDPAREALRSLGERQVDFGHDRVQILCVAPRGQDELVEIDLRTEGNVRILADPDRRLAERFGGGRVVYIGADGEVAERWDIQLDGTIADGVLERISATG
jgi:peroxiredoxin